VTNNELVLLDQILDQRQKERDAPLPNDRAFELFACEQALRDFEVSTDDILNGLVGGGGDGAIDGVYVFLGDSLLEEDDEVFGEDFAPTKVGQGARLSLWLVQAKREESFTGTALDLVASSTSRLLDLGKSDEDLLAYYSSALVGRVGLFRTALQKLAGRHPKVEIRFYYATRGSTETVDPKVLGKADDLREQFASTFSDAVSRVELLGAAELRRLASSLPSYTLELPYRENATSGSSHVALVSLRDYLEFLTDQNGNLRRNIFDWNVRDYQGDVEVNREIEASLRDPASPEFWWLNNGVTIIASKATIVGKIYALADVQIVNGLQTSHTIFNVLKELGQDASAFDRLILVRILYTDDPEARDKVIRATNKQTNVTAASLRATDDVQRSIEAFFLAKDWFYDRRKNYYRNIGKNPERIIGIPLLAQAIMAIGLSEPDSARARPSSLLKRDEDYMRVFSAKLPLSIYLWAAKTQKQVDAYLGSEEANLTPPERTNLRFHLAMLATAKLHGEQVHAPAQLARIAGQDTLIPQEDLAQALRDLQEYYRLYQEETGDTMDKAAKSRDFVEFVLEQAFPSPSGRTRGDLEATSERGRR